MITSRIQLKTSEQILKMRSAGLVVEAGLAAMVKAAKPGVTTREIDEVGRRVLAEHGATSNFLNYGAEWGYPPFPGVACISVNNTVVHGIAGDRTLAEGDIVSIDFGGIIDGWHGDAARTVCVGEVSDEARHLSEVTRVAMWDGIAAMWSGKRVGDVSHAIEASITAADPDLGIVEEFTGHGIGTAMHMEPDVPNFGRPGRGPRLKRGMCLAIEPIVTAGEPATATLDDGWTVVTVDRSWAAHWENTVARLDDGLWVLTERDGGARELGEHGIPLASLAK